MPRCLSLRFWELVPTGGRNLDFCHSTIPTVGLYGKQGEITAHIIRTSSTSTEMPPPPSAASIVTNRHCRLLPSPAGAAVHLPPPPARWGEGLSILLAAGAVKGRPAGARWRSVDDRSLPPSRRAACIYPGCRCRSRCAAAPAPAASSTAAALDLTSSNDDYSRLSW